MVKAKSGEAYLNQMACRCSDVNTGFNCSIHSASVRSECYFHRKMIHEPAGHWNQVVYEDSHRNKTSNFIRYLI